MAYCTFTNCLSILASGFTERTTLDSRSGVSYTSNGQMAFFGSSNDAGPLGMVFQHICGNSVCRADITATRYGISGNDLSLNVDSADPNTVGGLYIKYQGNVGIGTSNPSLHNGRGFVVRGTGADKRGIIELHDGCTTRNGKSVFQQVEGDTYIGQLSKGTGEGRVYFLTGGDGANATVSMTILCAGNVGIGTTSPVGKLDIATGGNTNIVISNDATDTGYNIVSLNGTRTKGSYAGIAGGGTSDNRLYLNSGQEVVIQTGASYTARMTITCAGNVGIGTSSPTEVAASWTTLDVTGKSSGGGGILYLSNFGKTVTSQFYSDGSGGRLGTLCNHFLALETCNTERMRISAAGNVGIGTTSPCNKLHLVGANHFQLVIQDSNAVMKLGTDDNIMLGIAMNANGITETQCDWFVGRHAAGTSGIKDAMYISRLGASVYSHFFVLNSSGSLGLGTETPSYRLHVNGTFYAAGSSIKYKEGICNYDTNSCLFMCLKPVTYQYKDEFKHLGKELKADTQIGLIAEDVAEVMPELAVLVNEEDEKVVRNVDYEKLSIVLLSELQKLRKEVDELKNNK